MADIRDLVITADRELFTEHDVSTLNRNFSPDYVEHSPLVANGLQGLSDLVEGAPGMRHDVARVLVDEANGLVALHGSYPGLDAEGLRLGFDIYRVADGKIVEHWDGLVTRAPPNESGHTQLDGTAHVDASADTEASRELVIEVWNSFLKAQDYRAMTDFTRPDGTFTQHSGDISDGVTPMVEFLEKLKQKRATLTYDRLHRTVAEGDFVLTHSEGSIGGERHSFCELWRIEHGFVVELWDAIGPVPPDEELAHRHGAFTSAAS